MNPNRHTPRHVIFKVAKGKDRILKAAREKQRVIYKEIPIRLSTDFSAESLKARRAMIKSSEREKNPNRRYSTQQHII